MTVLRPQVPCSEAAVLSAVGSPGLVLGVTTPLVTTSSELTNPGGSSLEGADEEDGLVLDPAILVLGDEDLSETMSQKPATPHDPPRWWQSCGDGSRTRRWRPLAVSRVLVLPRV